MSLRFKLKIMQTEKSYYFPFGQKLHPVMQTDCSPKKVFVLGVYASAVHACWKDAQGNQLVKALAVASEPEIFWTGQDAQKQIDKINIPEGVGRLVLPPKNLNGPSGRALDELFLKPLGINRADAWLSDLIPETRLNIHQVKAIKEVYEPFMKRHILPEVTIPHFSQDELNSDKRRQEIMKELLLSQSDTLILLGDLPIKWFLNYFSEKKFEGLASFGETPETYGLEHIIKLSGKPFKVIPLCHPRQAQRLGASSDKWYKLHNHWVKMPR